MNYRRPLNAARSAIRPLTKITSIPSRRAITLGASELSERLLEVGSLLQRLLVTLKNLEGLLLGARNVLALPRRWPPTPTVLDEQVGSANLVAGGSWSGNC
jgi:hypothetical protein